MKKTLLLSVILIGLCSLVYAMAVSARVQIKGKVLAIYEEPQLNEDDVDKNENLRVPYVLKIEIKKIYYKNSYDVWRIERFLERNNKIPVAKWSFKSKSNYEASDLKEGAVFKGFLFYKSMEYKAYGGYKTTWVLEINKIY